MRYGAIRWNRGAMRTAGALYRRPASQLPRLSYARLAFGYARRGMSAYVELQEREFGMEPDGYTATQHQREVGTGYFDLVAETISGGESSTLALEGSTEREQFRVDEA